MRLPSCSGSVTVTSMVPSPVDVMMGAARELGSVGGFGELDSVGGGVLARMKLELTEGSWMPLHTTGHHKGGSKQTIQGRRDKAHAPPSAYARSPTTNCKCNTWPLVNYQTCASLSVLTILTRPL